MRSAIFLVATLASTSLGAPTDVCGFTNDLDEFYTKVGGLIESVTGELGQSTRCDKSKIALPEPASGLPSPSGQKPLHVAIGRGTQVRAHSTTMSKSDF